MKDIRPALLAVALLVGSASAADRLAALPEIAGWMKGTELGELSGLAASRRRDDRFWALNDGGSPASLWALDRRGRLQGEVQVDGVANIDWEDLASFRLHGKPWLLIADSGDNEAIRTDVALYIVPEPRRASGSVQPVWTIRYRFPDAPHDSESVAVDADNGWVYLVNKRVRPSVLYRLPLEPPAGTTVTAEKVGELGGIPQPTPAQIANPKNFMRYASEPTGLDLSCDGRTLALLTYARLYLYERPTPDGDFAPVLDKPVDSVTLPPLPQAEAVAYSRHCSRIYVGSENPPVPLLRYRFRKASP